MTQHPPHTRGTDGHGAARAPSEVRVQRTLSTGSRVFVGRTDGISRLRESDALDRTTYSIYNLVPDARATSNLTTFVSSVHVSMSACHVRNHSRHCRAIRSPRSQSPISSHYLSHPSQSVESTSSQPSQSIESAECCDSRMLHCTVLYRMVMVTHWRLPKLRRGALGALPRARHCRFRWSRSC